MSHASLKWVSRPAAGLALACAGLACAALGGAPPALAAAADSHAPVVYRWVDGNGVTHFGDRVPPRYAQQATTILNDQGVVIGQVAAEKTPAELAAAHRAEQQLAEQKQRDTFLLTTYSSVEDIEQLRDQRIKQIEGQLLASEQYIASLHDRLLALQTRALHCKPYDREPGAQRLPDDLAEQLVRTVDEMQVERDALTAKDQQVASVRAQFQADIDRFRELRAGTR